MSTLTITSPGVQINEVDLSLIANTQGSTSVLAVGFTDQGPTNELVNVSSISEFESIYGVPTNSAERYLYHSARQILNTSPASLLISRLPYGSGRGLGYANSYSALVYPISTNLPKFSDATSYSLLEPISILLSDDEYTQIQQNNVTWSQSPYTLSSVTVGASAGADFANFNSFITAGSVNSATDIFSIVATTSTLSSIEFYPNVSGAYIQNTFAGFADLSANFSAGLVIVNDSKSSVDNLYQGYYIGICDNSNINPSTNFNSITGVKAVYEINTDGTEQDFTTVKSGRFNFALSSVKNGFGGTSISETLESLPTSYSFSTSAYSDSISLVVFKLHTSTYNQDTVILSSSVAESYVGSLYANRTQSNPNGGAPVTFYIDNVVNNSSSNISVITNPYISKQGQWGTTDSKGHYISNKTVRVADGTKNLYSTGVYQSDTDYTTKDVGNIPAKLQNILSHLQNNDTIQLDITIEAGLGTIWASAKALSAQYAASPYTANLPLIYDETYNYSTALTPLYATNGDSSAWSTLAGFDYLSIADQFVSLANDTRKDHIFIADPIRHLLVQGADSKVTSQHGFIFSDDIYWPLNNQFGSINSSYVTTYANWFKYNDTASNKPVWIPSSGYAAAKMATTFQQSFPWTAVAGLNRGILTNVIDIAINPTQKQRDLLYKVSLNPVAYFPNEGYAIFGQKTLYRTPSAFNRINVRELFLSLEKTTQSLLKYFVFEPNTYTTQTRLVGSLKPAFDNAKINGGLYDYLIVCDNRNNTPTVIDNNQLVVSIYIQPVKTAEFILCDFIATQTGVNFSELVANNQF
jgi:hypothetical protein